MPTDPWFPRQWYMVSGRPGRRGGPGWSSTDPHPLSPQNNEVQPDLNIQQVWGQGLSGQGIVVSVLDDGIEKDHPDLWANYVSSWGAGQGLPQVWWPAPTPSRPHPAPRTPWPATTSTTTTQTPSRDTHPVMRTGEPRVPHEGGPRGAAGLDWGPPSLSWRQARDPLCWGGGRDGQQQVLRHRSGLQRPNRRYRIPLLPPGDRGRPG